MKVNKFRMWDKRLKKMAFTGYSVVGEVTAFNGMEHWIQENWELTKDECPTSMERWNDFVEMQYANIEDSNGQEAYEGDIFSFTNLKLESQYFQIFRVRGGFAINTHSDDFNKPADHIQFYTALSDMQTASWFSSSCEIIGNVYENENLLT